MKWHFHRWGKWVDYDKIRTHIPLGNAYPEEVRGKTFETKIPIQIRECEVCGRKQMRNL